MWVNWIAQVFIHDCCSCSIARMLNTTAHHLIVHGLMLCIFRVHNPKYCTLTSICPGLVQLFFSFSLMHLFSPTKTQLCQHIRCISNLVPLANSLNSPHNTSSKHKETHPDPHNYSAPPQQDNPRQVAIPPLPQWFPCIRKRHNLHKYNSPQQMGATICIAVLALSHIRRAYSQHNHNGNLCTFVLCTSKQFMRFCFVNFQQIFWHQWLL